MASKRLRWFDPYRRLGWTIEQARRSGHLKIRDADGAYIATVSNSPGDTNWHKQVQRELRRHAERRQTSRATG
jgi:hypothetical protein